MLRTIGMTRRQARRMIRHESVITALIGAALGLPLGILLSALVTQALSQYDVGMSIPVGMLARVHARGGARRHRARRSSPRAGPRGSTCSTPCTTNERDRHNALPAARRGRGGAGAARPPGAPAPGGRARARDARTCSTSRSPAPTRRCSACSRSSPFPAAWLALQPRLIRPTRFALGLVVGLLAIGFGVVSHGLHVVNSGPDWRDLTGVGMIAGGVAPGRLRRGGAGRAAPAPRGRPSACCTRAGWLVGARARVRRLLMPFSQVLLVTHAPRWAIQEASLGIPHEEVTVADGRRPRPVGLVGARRATARPCCVDHGSGGSRERVVGAHPHARPPRLWRARARPARQRGERGALERPRRQRPARGGRRRWPGSSRRDGVDPDRIAGYGLSLGAEVLIEAAARDDRLSALVADGATRPQDAQDVLDPDAAQRGARRGSRSQGVRGVSGMRTSTSLNPLIERIAPRPVLLVAAGGFEQEIPANRVYREHGGPDDGALRAAGRRPHRRPAQAPGGVRGAHDRVPRPRARPLTPWGRARGHLPADGGRRGGVHRCDAAQPSAARALGGRSGHARGVRRLPRQGGGAAAQRTSSPGSATAATSSATSTSARSSRARCIRPSWATPASPASRAAG